MDVASERHFVIMGQMSRSDAGGECKRPAPLAVPVVSVLVCVQVGEGGRQTCPAQPRGSDGQLGPPTRLDTRRTECMRR